MDVLVVVCFLWGDWGAPYGPTYVNRLMRGVRRHLTGIPYRFVCFTDHPADVFDPDVEARALTSPSWNGKLPKITVFDPRHAFAGRVLVLDLDAVIIGSLNDIAMYRGDFCVTARFAPAERGEWVADGDMLGFSGGYGVDTLWRPFVEDPKHVEEITGCREREWYRLVTKPDLWQRLYPGQILSYKTHCKDLQTPPRGARIVSFHGHPKPHEVAEQWVRDHWI